MVNREEDVTAMSAIDSLFDQVSVEIPIGGKCFAYILNHLDYYLNELADKIAVYKKEHGIV